VSAPSVSVGPGVQNQPFETSGSTMGKVVSVGGWKHEAIAKGGWYSKWAGCRLAEGPE
jgi:hypothetical protein